MGVDPPYIYPLSVPYSDFDPKAITRSSWTPRTPNFIPKQEGPLLNFNRHPDSWLVGPSPRDHVATMSTRSKRSIIATRWVQLGSRILQELATIGLLVSVICIKNVPDTDSYIMRVPPGVDILSSAYAIYHLARPAKSRTAGSSASYHVFASAMDVCFLPFYVFTFLRGRAQLAPQLDSKALWGSLFKSPGAPHKLTMTIWIVSITLVGLHALTLALSIYLWFMFHKIDNLPPDMNPLEDNLTSRRKAKHNYKSSHATLTEKQMHDSAVSLVHSGKEPSTRERPVSFFHTRDDSSTQFSPHNPRTAAAASRGYRELPVPGMYEQSELARHSQTVLPYPQPRNTGRTSPSRAGSPSRISHGFMSEPSSHLPTMKSMSSGYSTADEDRHAPRLPRKSSKRVAASDGNWMVLEGEDCDSSDAENHYPATTPVDGDDQGEQAFAPAARVNRHAPSAYSVFKRHTYEPVWNPAGFSTDDGDLSSRRFCDETLPGNEEPRRPISSFHSKQNSISDATQPLQPLSMNPPSPPASSYYSTRDSKSTLWSEASSAGEVVKPMAASPARAIARGEAHGLSASPSRPGTASRNQVGSHLVKPASVAGAYTDNAALNSAPNSRSSSPAKGKYYGDIRSAMQGIRQSSPKPNATPPPKPGDWMGNKGGDGQWPLRDRGAGAYGSPKTRADERVLDGGSRGRVISRSGVDLGDGGAGPWPDEDLSHRYNGDAGGVLGGAGARIVSGKIAEEGLGGGWARRRPIR